MAHALIIEDEPIIAMEVESILAELGFESFDFAVSPADALAMAIMRRPDLVTADYRIVGGTGEEAVTAIYAALGRVPVVFVTGNPEAVVGQFAEPIVDKPIAPGALAAAWRSAAIG